MHRRCVVARRRMTHAEAAALTFQFAAIRSMLSGIQFLYSDERELQSAIVTVLQEAGEPVATEVRHGLQGLHRFDIVVRERIVLECKVGGALSDALRQIDRYLSLDIVDGLLLCGPQVWKAAPSACEELARRHGKPVAFIPVTRAAF